MEHYFLHVPLLSPQPTNRQSQGMFQHLGNVVVVGGGGAGGGNNL